MNSADPWTLLTADRAQKILARAPRHERDRLRAELDAIKRDPFGSNTQRLHGALEHSYRRRVGDYRILYTVAVPARLITVTEITRRTSTTY
jgi:mRNA-degrading endonuclease RelE of RelBE toxin-antitoxin system